MWHKRDARLRKFLEQQRLRALLAECTAAAAAKDGTAAVVDAAASAGLAAAARAHAGMLGGVQVQ